METNVRDTSLEVYDKFKIKLNTDQQTLFKALLDIGPTHDRRLLEYLNQSEKQKPQNLRKVWEISAVTGRRNQLICKGAVIDLGPHLGIWNGVKRRYHIWAVNHEMRQPAGWTKIEDKKSA